MPRSLAWPCLLPYSRVQHGLNQQFGFRPGDQGPRVTPDLQPHKIDMTDHILQGFTGFNPTGQRVQCPRLLPRQRPVTQVNLQRFTIHDMGQQFLRRAFGIVDACGEEPSL